MTKNYRAQAEALAGKGRYGDTTLMHVNEAEVEALEGIAGLFGRELTENPDTGLKEAFNLFDILPFALNFIFPGMGTAAQIGIGALSGAASSAVEGGDPLTGALTGGAMSGIGSALFGGAPGVDPAAAQLTEQAKSLGGAFGGQAGFDAGMAQAAAAQKAAAPGFWDADFTMRDFGADSGLNRWLDDPLSKGNLPYTLAGGAATASLLDNFNPFGAGDIETGDEEGKKAHLRYPAAPRPYQPLNTPDLNTYGQPGSDYQSEVNYFLNNPGPYTGAPYEGDPYAYPFKEGGLACYADGGEVDKPAAFRNAMKERMMGIWSQVPAAAQDRLRSIPWAQQNIFSRFGQSAQPEVAIQPAGPAIPASLAMLSQVQPGASTVTEGAVGNGRLGRRSAQGRSSKFSDAAPFVMPQRQIIPQQAPVAQSAPMMAEHASFNPVNFSPVRGFSGGGIASMPGVVDQRILGQLMAGGGEVGGSDPGMADTVPASIDGQAPARLSSGEYVVPADVVSMLGDGNTKAGAQVLRSMVERVRLHKTGSAGQAAEIDPEQVLPA